MQNYQIVSYKDKNLLLDVIVPLLHDTEREHFLCRTDKQGIINVLSTQLSSTEI